MEDAFKQSPEILQQPSLGEILNNTEASVEEKLLAIKEKIGSKDLDEEIKNKVLEIMEQAVDTYYLPMVKEKIDGKEEGGAPVWGLMNFFRAIYRHRKDISEELCHFDVVGRSGRSIGTSAATNMSQNITENRIKGFEEVTGLTDKSGSGSTMYAYFLKKGSGLDGLKAFVQKRESEVFCLDKGDHIDLYVRPGLKGRIIGRGGETIREISRILFPPTREAKIPKRIDVKEVQPSEGDCFKTQIIAPLNMRTLTYVPTTVNLGYTNGEYFDINGHLVNGFTPTNGFSDYPPKDPEMKGLPHSFGLAALTAFIRATQKEIDDDEYLGKLQLGLMNMSKYPEFWQVLSKLLKGQDTRVVDKSSFRQGIDKPGRQE